MAYKPKDMFFPPVTEGKVRTSGSSLTLTPGELTLVNVKNTTRQGVQIIDNITSLPNDHKLCIRMGQFLDTANGLGRTETNKDYSTISFKTSDVSKVYVDAPTKGKADVDDFVLGFNGEDGTEIDLDNGENEIIELTLKGNLMGMIGLPDNRFTIRVNLTAPSEGVKGVDWTMEEIVTNSYKTLKNIKLPGNIPVTNYVDFMLVNSENPATLPGTDVSFYEINVKDDGTSVALGAISSNYPTLDIKRKSYKNGESIYVAIASSAPADYSVETSYELSECDECPTGYTLQGDLCVSAPNCTYSWSQGDTCKQTTQEYKITLVDTKCGDSRLTELQEFYPELTITEGASFGCQRVYTTTVPTSLVCEECDPIYRDLFTSEAPEPFDTIHWTTSEPTYSADAKMGIRVRGKQAVLSGQGYLAENLPFVHDSVEIALVGGLPGHTNESYLCGTSGRFNLKYFSRKTSVSNLGGNLRKYERESNVYFRGDYDNTNWFSSLVKGTNTKFDGLKQYVVYSVTISPLKIDSNFQQAQTGAFTYHFPVELGKQAEVEAMVNKLATAANLPTVSAY